MLSTRALSLLVLAALAVSAAGSPAPRIRRQLADDNALQPIEGAEGAEGDEQARDKRKFEGVTQAKFGIKNAVLGFVFGSGTTWRAPQRRPLKSSFQQEAQLNGNRLQRQATSTDSIPVFDRNKVSLDFPGNLFGPSVSLLIRTTKIIGDVIQNSAVRYQSFLRLFRPLFRGPFEIKGLDPPTTTTTTTTTTTQVPAATDNEVRRR